LLCIGGVRDVPARNLGREVADERWRMMGVTVPGVKLWQWWMDDPQQSVVIRLFRIVKVTGDEVECDPYSACVVAGAQGESAVDPFAAPLSDFAQVGGAYQLVSDV
jgi:hypothetical protein